MRFYCLASPVLLVVSMAAHAAPPGNPYPMLEQTGERYEFIINADPQMGPKDSKHKNEQHLFALLQEFVREVNGRAQAPAFVLFDGDLVAHAKPEYFDAFVEACEGLKPAAVLVHGNHDGRHPDTNFLRIQQQMSGFQAYYYSFNCGRWHFVILPAKEQIPDRKTEQELLGWLRQDLAAHSDRPTMVFEHYHLLPMGLSQGEYYTLDMDFKNELIDLLATAGNVRYVVSGHVHAGIKSSSKISWEYRGINFFVAPSPVAPRAYGEEFAEFTGDGIENEGYYLVAQVDGDTVKFVGRKIGHDATFEYPATFPAFRDEMDPRWNRRTGTLEARAALANGTFDAGTDGWLMPWRYVSDEAPGFVWNTEEERKDNPALHLYCREKGQHWAYDEYLEQYQLVSLPPGEAPVFKASYRVPLDQRSSFGGGYLRLTAYSDAGAPEMMMFFHWGAREERMNHLLKAIPYSDLGQSMGMNYIHARAKEQRFLAWRVPDYHYRWNHLEVNVPELYDRAVGKPGAFESLQAAKLLVGLGVWCGSEPGMFSGAYFDDVSVSFGETTESTVNDIKFPVSERVFQPPFGVWHLDGFDK